jgi:peptidyl-prolyl cis-trans isomerase SurA
MKHLKYPILFCLLSYLSCYTAVGASLETLDKVAALVNNDVIALSELNRQVDLTKKQLLMENQDLPNETNLRQHVLDGLINLKLQQQVAQKLQLEVSDKQLDAEIKQIAARNHLNLSQLLQQIKSTGLTMKQYRQQLRQQILISQVQQKMIAGKIVITPQQIEDFLKQQKSASANLAEYHLQHIVLALPDNPSTATLQDTRQQAEKICQQLQHGAKFSTLVSKKSAAEDALRGGDLGWRKPHEMPEAFAHAVKQLKPNGISKPIQTSNGFHILKLVAKRQHEEKHYGTQYHIRQIFMKADDLTSNQEVQRKLNNIRQHLQRGEKFPEFAKTFSQDQNSASNNGDMGWLFADEMPPQLAQVITQIQIKAIPKPVRTGVGWHLIQVLNSRSVEDSARLLKTQARQLLYQQKMHLAQQNWLQSLHGQAYITVKQLV